MRNNETKINWKQKSCASAENATRSEGSVSKWFKISHPVKVSEEENSKWVISYSVHCNQPSISHCFWDMTSYKQKYVVFTARCTLVQSAVLRSHVVCLSVCLSVCDVGELWSSRLEFFENN